MYILKNKTFSKPKFTTGFTLVELLITIVIFVMLTGVVLFNQNKFDSTILLKNLAYDIALTIRQAQTYGVNVRESQETGTFSSYGVYFNREKQNNFILFADINNNGMFDEGVDGECTIESECIQKYNLKKGNYISGLCIGDDQYNCDPVDSLIIYFKRPNPDAKIFSKDSSEMKFYSNIEISSVRGVSSSSIIVTGPGQIYVK